MSTNILKIKGMGGMEDVLDNYLNSKGALKPLIIVYKQK